ncbi:DNA-binding protein RFX6-like [Patiria miniata]|uniref:DNA-binding protein RFX6 n=1 Tax=Patiria miniata TaxID=46514 RepID=A0A913ZPU6_PATMI|nr:DNA-binding protein RFX6-like [Patiria miniata]
MSNQLEPDGQSLEQPDETDANQTGQTQLHETLRWLNENYERSEGVCLPRCVLYTHYLDLCKKRLFTPAGAATFGKIIRQMFPKLTTRRLGTRGQSKYHYYGIGIKKTSIYYHSVYSGKGLSRFSETKVKTEGSARKFSLSSKSGTLLPDFPTAGNLVIPDDISAEKVETFLLMYQTHCQRILDTIVSSNFEEVQNFLLHFWQGMPKHMQSLLSSDVIIDVIALCDSVLYKVLADVLIPSTIQDIPEGLSFDIRTFAKKLPVWLDSSLDQMCKELRVRKMKVLSSFVRSLRRQTSFVQLAQTARSVLLSQETVSQMTRDLAELNFNGNMTQADVSQSAFNAAKAVLQEFKGLLAKQAPLEAYIEWIDSLIDRFVLQKMTETDYSSRSASFILQWSFFTSKIMRDLTLQRAASFGSLHLIHMMLTEYAFLVVESQQDQYHHAEMVDHVQRNMKQTEEICTKATVRSSLQRSSPGSAAVKTKRRKCSTNQTEDEPPKDPLTTAEGNQRLDAEFQDCGTVSSQQVTSLDEGALHANDDFSETCTGGSLSDHPILSSSHAFRPFGSQREAQPAVTSHPPFADDPFQNGCFSSAYANSYCDLYPVHASSHAHSSYKPLHQHYSHRHLPLPYGNYNLPTDDSGYTRYASGYELIGAPPVQHSGYGTPSAHSQRDIPDTYGCFMRANEALVDAHRHSHLRFTPGYENGISHQAYDSNVWFNPTVPGCMADTSTSRPPPYQTTEEFVPGTQADSSFVGSSGSGSRFMEIVHGTAPARDQASTFEQTAGYQLTMMAPYNTRGSSHLSRPNPY